jgi:multidrug efflux pump
LNSYGLGLQDVKNMLSQQNANEPKGQIWDGHTTADILANDQLLKADYYKPLIVGYHNGAAIKLADIADVQDSVENIRTAGFFDGKPCVTMQHLSAAQRQYHRHESTGSVRHFRR